MPQTLCVAGRVDQYIEHGGYTWRTLDGAAPQGGTRGAPNDGCQCNVGHSFAGSDCPSNYLPLPEGWVLAPNDATSIDYDSDCHPYQSGVGGSNPATDNWPECSDPGVSGSPGDSCVGSTLYLATSGGTYTVTYCFKRVLARCG